MRKGYLWTYIKTILLIILIGLIIGGAIYFMRNKYNDEQLETIKTNMLLIQGETKIIREKINMKEKGVSYIGIKIDKETENEDIKTLQDNGVIDTTSKDNNYYILEKGHLEELGLNQISLDEGYYIVEYNGNEIIYSKGVQDKGGNTLYKLTDIKNIH